MQSRFRSASTSINTTFKLCAASAGRDRRPRSLPDAAYAAGSKTSQTTKKIKNATGNITSSQSYKKSTGEVNVLETFKILQNWSCWSQISIMSNQRKSFLPFWHPQKQNAPRRAAKDFGIGSQKATAGLARSCGRAGGKSHQPIPCKLQSTSSSTPWKWQKSSIHLVWTCKMSHVWM